ncbi:uncharacterized protein LOC134538550 [Bacillus rossius redtenbacheri]|uniref:uncharacterized protein LOC134538550 n=1 Tax=Bacillus rossius redtenbacheri TaxID=93214 RepID=UPI002FDE22E0
MCSRGPLLLALLAGCCLTARAQSNYADQGNDVAFGPPEEGLPPSAVLDGKVTKLDDLSPVIFLNRTKAALNCAAGSMQVELKFNEKFFGIAYADFNRNSACKVVGKGATSYRLELPLKGCGTKQEPQRVFTNNIVVRFHAGLEMDGDEVITIVCRYPPPIAPPPAALPNSIINLPPTPDKILPPLQGYQILLIVCAILFLSLLLLGLGCSYVCLKRRRVAVVRRHPFSTASGSEITKLSGSSLGNISVFEGLKIPRAHAQAAGAGGSTSGSEAALIVPGGEHSDTLPSDYPSESPSSAHSEVEDVDTRSLRRPSTVSSAGSYDNKGFVQHQEGLAGFYSEGYGRRDTAVVPQPPPEPKFDVSVRVKRAAPSPPADDAESAMSIQARNLTTILEHGEDSMLRAVETSRPPAMTTFSYVPDVHPPPPPARLHTAAPPVYSRVLRRQQETAQAREASAVDTLSQRSIPDNDDWSQAEDFIDAPQRRMSIASGRSLASLNTEMTDTRSMSEFVDASHKRYAASSTVVPPPPPPPPVVPPARYASQVEVPARTADVLEPPVVVSRRPEITSHVVDDVFLRTITEKRTVEDVERHRRQVTEYHAARPQPPPINPQWDVVIRNYPAPGAEEAREPARDWDSYSEASTTSGYQPVTVDERHTTRVNVQQNYLSNLEIPPRDVPLPNWDVLVRVLNPEPEEQLQPLDTGTEVFRQEATLTVEDREKWRQIITTESTLRTLLTEATVREDFERIRSDQRYEQLFEPRKWDVIIRVLAPPERPSYDQRGGSSSGGSRYRRKSDWDTRSRRSSLPTLYEYDSDGGSSVRTLTAEAVPPPPAAMRSRRTSRSSLRSDADLRSMSEMTVDFARPDRADSLSDTSSYSRRRSYDDDELLGRGSAYDEDLFRSRRLDTASLVRSASQPSLARSASEFTEQWLPPAAAWDPDTPEPSPGLLRRLPPGGVVFSTTTTTTRQEMFQQQGWFGDAESEASFK